MAGQLGLRLGDALAAAASSGRSLLFVPGNCPVSGGKLRGTMSPEGRDLDYRVDRSASETRAGVCGRFGSINIWCPVCEEPWRSSAQASVCRGV